MTALVVPIYRITCAYFSCSKSLRKGSENMLYILDRYEQGKAILTNDSPTALGYYDDKHLEQLDGILSYEFCVPANHEQSSEIIVEGYVLVRDLDKKLIQFKIKRIEEIKDGNGVSYRRVYAENAAINDLRGEIVRPIKLTAASLEQAATHALTNTGWILGDYDSAAGLNDYDFTSYPTGLAALNIIKDTLDLEIAYRVEYNGAQVRAKYVDLVSRRGSDTGKRFEYSKDLVSVKREEDSTELITALIGIGKSNEDGTRVTFADIEYTDNGYYKPLGQDWVGDDEALAQFGKNGKHIFGVFEDSTSVAWTTLLSGATKELAKRSKPRTTYEVSVMLLERLIGYPSDKVRLGDRILVLDKTFVPALIVEARVIELTRSYTDPTKDSVILGEFAPVFIDTSADLESFKRFVNSKTGAWDAPSETIYKNAVEPADKKLNMLWLDLSKKPNLLNRWDGAVWQKASATEFSEVNGQVTTIQIGENAVTTDQIAPSAVTNTEIAEDAVTTVKIAPNAVTALQIAPISIQAVHIEDAAVEAKAIKDGAISATKLMDAAVTQSKLAPNSVTDTHIEAGVISEAKMKWTSHLIF
jgi:phage minor structural protein